MTDYKKVADYMAAGIYEWFQTKAGYKSEDDWKAVVGISGGKDSSVVAALLCNAIGKEKVYGILMPDGEQKDIQYAKDLCNLLGINSMTVNIENPLDSLMFTIQTWEGPDFADMYGFSRDQKVTTNLPARLRMCVEYAIANHINARVIGTSNFAERMLGWGTLWGDTVCDFNPIADLYVDEVIAVGEALGLPERFTRKPPSDGMCGKTDEEALGFTYDQFKEWWPNRGRYDKDVEPWRSISMRVNSATFKRELLRGIPAIKLPRNDAGDIEL